MRKLLTGKLARVEAREAAEFHANNIPPPVEPGDTLIKTKSEKADLKPRGEKAQFWLGVKPTVWADLVVPLSYDRDIDVAEAVECYQMSPSSAGALHMAEDLVRTIARDHKVTHYKALELVCGVFEYGAKKYAPGNFRNAFSDMESMRREYPSAIMRHMLEYWLGSYLDLESQLLHPAHAACGALMLVEGERALEAGADQFAKDCAEYPIEGQGGDMTAKDIEAFRVLAASDTHVETQPLRAKTGPGRGGDRPV